MRFSLPLSLVLVVAAIAASSGAARRARLETHARHATRASVVAAIDHYRRLAWTYQEVARIRRTPSTFSYRRTPDGAYLRWSLVLWERRTELARRHALVRLQRRLGVRFPAPPAPHAALATRVAFNRKLTLRLCTIYPGPATARRLRLHVTGPALRFWERHAAAVALTVSHYVNLPTRTLLADDQLTTGFLCIHHYEGAWSANTGNGYYGGLQMDLGFQQTYGGAFLARWGTADKWPPWAQIQAARRAYASGRGFSPWPRSSAACGLA